jgi:GxxExxY protein
MVVTRFAFAWVWEPLNYRETPVSENELSRHIIDAAIEVQRELGGPGLLESVYEEALASELSARGFGVRRQVPVPIIFKGRALSSNLRVDMIVEGLLIVECKSLVAFNRIYPLQTLTYLRVSKLRLALLINFGSSPLRQGIHRIVNGLPD